MTEMIIVEYADLGGTGFSRYEPDGRPKAAREFWRAAEEMLTAEVAQPPESIRSTIGHPIWSLHWVRVDTRPYWCFSVQGRGGPFGVAGTCRFAFLPGGTHPAEAWDLGAQALGGDDRGPGADAGTVADGLADTLGAILGGADRIAIPGTPAVAAEVIGALLYALPRSVAESLSWSTCLLQRPDVRRHGVIAGTWPMEFRESAVNLSRNIAQLLTAPVQAESFLAGLRAERDRAAFDWLVGQGMNGEPVDGQLVYTGTRADALLAAVSSQRGPITAADVPRLLRDRLRLRDLTDELFADWVALDAETALEMVYEQPDLPRRDLIFQLVVAERLRPGRHGNLLRLPSARTAPDDQWRDDLVHLIREAATARGQAPGDLIDELVEACLGPEDVLAVRPLVEELGGWSPASLPAIAEGLHARRSDPDLQKEIGRLELPMTDLGEQLRRLGLTLTPDYAGELVRVALWYEVSRPGGFDTKVKGRLRALASTVAAARGAGVPRDRWALGFLLYLEHEVTAADRVTEAMVGMFAGLGVGGEPLPEGELRDVCARIAGTSPPSEIEKLLRKPPVSKSTPAAAPVEEPAPVREQPALDVYPSGPSAQILQPRPEPPAVPIPVVSPHEKPGLWVRLLQRLAPDSPSDPPTGRPASTAPPGGTAQRRTRAVTSPAGPKTAGPKTAGPKTGATKPVGKANGTRTSGKKLVPPTGDKPAGQASDRSRDTDGFNKVAAAKGMLFGIAALAIMGILVNLMLNWLHGPERGDVTPSVTPSQTASAAPAPPPQPGELASFTLPPPKRGKPVTADAFRRGIEQARQALGKRFAIGYIELEGLDPADAAVGQKNADALLALLREEGFNVQINPMGSIDTKAKPGTIVVRLFAREPVVEQGRGQLR